MDTAVRTSDIGYLTHKLIEVVQHCYSNARDISTSSWNEKCSKLIFITKINFLFNMSQLISIRLDHFIKKNS